MGAAQADVRQAHFLDFNCSIPVGDRQFLSITCAAAKSGEVGQQLGFS